MKKDPIIRGRQMTASKLNLSESSFKLENSPSIIVGTTKVVCCVVVKCTLYGEFGLKNIATTN